MPVKLVNGEVKFEIQNPDGIPWVRILKAQVNSRATFILGYQEGPPPVCEKCRRPIDITMPMIGYKCTVDPKLFSPVFCLNCSQNDPNLGVITVVTPPQSQPQPQQSEGVPMSEDLFNDEDMFTEPVAPATAATAVAAPPAVPNGVPTTPEALKARTQQIAQAKMTEGISKADVAAAVEAGLAPLKDEVAALALNVKELSKGLSIHISNTKAAATKSLIESVVNGPLQNIHDILSKMVPVLDFLSTGEVKEGSPLVHTPAQATVATTPPAAPTTEAPKKAGRPPKAAAATPPPAAPPATPAAPGAIVLNTPQRLTIKEAVQKLAADYRGISIPQMMAALQDPSIQPPYFKMALDPSDAAKAASFVRSVRGMDAISILGVDTDPLHQTCEPLPGQ